MLFGSPISWVLTELFAVIVFFACMYHATKQSKPFIRILELFGFVVGAALFENVGVFEAHTYYYDVRRVLMVGGVPLEILFLEAAIWYAAFNLALRLVRKLWAVPFVVGLFGSIQDMTVDPSAVFDRYALSADVAAKVEGLYPGAFGEGGLSGQWNWSNPGYDGGFFDIPWYNFSGWMYLMVWFTAWVLVGRWLHSKFENNVVGFTYPILAGVLNVVTIATPLTRFLLFGWGSIETGEGSAAPQLTLLCFNYALAIMLLAVFWRSRTKIDLRRNGWVIFGVPIALHVFDIVYAFAMGTTVAYVPALVVGAIHVAFLALVLVKNKSAAEPTYSAIDPAPATA
ncbi:hypothetical protein [Demequina sp. NBRC 110054]|uniref:hypothetical protein n=1 Tax=Demequina sp. NBRC 110054 TaxID=1570343 RepID=UPI0009FBA431|nr:hypothetical protein [Demequina sp. NBRC 110054]